MYVHNMYMYIHLNTVCNMYIHVHAFLYMYVCCTYIYIDVDTCLENFGHCTDTCVQLPNLTAFPIRPDQPCDAGESQLRAGASPSEQPSSWHQSFQLTDHPGAAYHAQTATATGSPHTHCCHAGHPLLQCHRCPTGSQTSCAGCTCEEW